MIDKRPAEHLARQVRIERLSLQGFRNYVAMTVAFDRALVVLTGENGAGKTNILEAISLLSPGRGLRRATLPAMARQGSEGGFAIHARLNGPLGEVEIGTGTFGESSSEGTRKVRINGAPARSAEDLLEWVRVVWLVPAMDALFTGPASERRRFLDRLVLAIDPEHGRRALDYEKSMRARNRLLSEGARDDAWLSAIETQMAETGVAIAAARNELVRLLAEMIARLPADGPFPRALLSLDGVVEARAAAMPAVEVEEWLRAELSAGRTVDRHAGRTLIGPHRSDLLVRHEAKDMPAELSSTGEQKALLTGLVLSHARLVAELSGMTPILLLDEIAAHLDAGRRAALFEILGELGGQTFMTGTDAALFSAIAGEAQFLTVAAGTVEERVSV